VINSSNENQNKLESSIPINQMLKRKSKKINKKRSEKTNPINIGKHVKLATQVMRTRLLNRK
jgi:hypothetical protein